MTDIQKAKRRLESRSRILAAAIVDNSISTPELRSEAVRLQISVCSSFMGRPLSYFESQLLKLENLAKYYVKP